MKQIREEHGYEEIQIGIPQASDPPVHDDGAARDSAL